MKRVAASSARLPLGMVEKRLQQRPRIAALDKVSLKKIRPLLEKTECLRDFVE